MAKGAQIVCVALVFFLNHGYLSVAESRFLRLICCVEYGSRVVLDPQCLVFGVAVKLLDERTMPVRQH